MTVLTLRLREATLTVDTETGQIQWIEDWFYDFVTDRSMGHNVSRHGRSFGWITPDAWPARERARFHETVRAQIRRVWNTHPPILVSGSGSFARRFPRVR